MDSVTIHTRRIARLAPSAADRGSDALGYVAGAVDPSDMSTGAPSRNIVAVLIGSP